MMIPREEKLATRFNRLHYLIDALLGIEVRSNPIILLTVRPKAPIPLLRKRRSALISGGGSQKPHQIMTIDRVRGRNKQGNIRLLEFSEAKNWEELEHTHIRLFQSQPPAANYDP